MDADQARRAVEATDDQQVPHPDGSGSTLLTLMDGGGGGGSGGKIRACIPPKIRQNAFNRRFVSINQSVSAL